jgi:hypothetical protein
VVADNTAHPKSSASARFQGRREVVVVADNRAYILDFEGGERWWGQTTHRTRNRAYVLDFEGGEVVEWQTTCCPRNRACTRAERGGGDSEHTTCVHPRLREVACVVCHCRFVSAHMIHIVKENIPCWRMGEAHPFPNPLVQSVLSSLWPWLPEKFETPKTSMNARSGGCLMVVVGW